MKFVYFVKWIWNNLNLDHKLAIGGLLSAVLSLFVNEFAYLAAGLFILLMTRFVIDIVKDTWKDFEKSQNSLVDTIKNTEEK